MKPIQLKASHLRHGFTTLILAILAVGCGLFEESDDPSSITNLPDIINEGAIGLNSDTDADTLFEAYFEEYLQLYPSVATKIGDHRYDDRIEVSISDDHRQKQSELANKYLIKLREVDQEALSADRRLSLDLLRHELRDNLLSLNYPGHLMPIHTVDCFPDEFATLGSGGGDHPFETAEDYGNFLTRIDSFISWVDTAILNMRSGVRRGYVLPTVVAEATIRLLERQLVQGVDDSVFSKPLEHLPEVLSPREQNELRQRYRSAIDTKVLPAYRRLVDFLRLEYLPECRETVGWSALPDGEAWYRHLVRSWTTTEMSNEQIHDLGLREVARLSTLFQEVQDRVPPDYEVPTYDNEMALVEAYAKLEVTLAPGLEVLFGFAPETSLEIRGSHLGAHYRPGSADGARPGRFLVGTQSIETNPRSVSEALFLHEAVPGHHYQISLQQEASLPRFRKHAYMYAYIEGWGLYAESLGPELGLFADPAADADRLHSELFRAIRLVVDTGIHSKGWTADQALDFFRQHLGYAPGREVIRYIAWPAQALTYKVGEQKIVALRERARSALGSNFDIRDFHRRVLEAGPLPLVLLERSIDEWIASESTG